MKISTTNCEQAQNGNIFCCLFEKIRTNAKFLLPLILFFGLIQGVFAQGTLQPACNIGGPLEGCAKNPSSNTDGDMIIEIDVARSGINPILTYFIDPVLNSSGAFIRSFGPEVYHGPLDPVIALRNHTTQTLIVYPGGTGAGFNLQLDVENTESSPHTFSSCSKSVSVSELTADSSHTPILCFGGLSTLTAEGHLSDTGGYTYTLLPGGPTNTTGIFPNLPGSVAGITYTVEVVSAENCVEYTSQTITQPADNPVVLNCPQNASVPACSTLEQVTLAYNNWRNSFSFTGGTNPVLTVTPTPAVLPAICGGIVEVRWDVTSDCFPTLSSCSRTFRIVAPAPAVIECGDNVTLPACSTEAQVVAAWAAFISQGGAGGGCIGDLSVNANEPPPICGGSLDVKWTYTSSCEAPLTCTRTFAITAPTPVTLTCPQNVNLVGGLLTQAEVELAYDDWLTSVTYGGGCNPSISNNSLGAPNRCGGVSTVTYTVTSDCEGPKQCTATFSTGSCIISHIFPTQTTCCNFTTGTATGLYNVCTTVVGPGTTGGTVSNAIPGVFFYYSNVVAPAANFTIEVKQSNEGDLNRLFEVHGYDKNSLSQIRLFTNSCGAISFTPSFINSGKGAKYVVRGATPGATYIVSIKYAVKSLIGGVYSGADRVSTYTFGSYLNGSAVATAGSVGTIDAVSGCSDNTPLPGNCSIARDLVDNVIVKNNGLSVMAYPNPFKDHVSFEIVSDTSGKATLEIFNILGQRVNTAFDGYLEAGKPEKFEVEASKLATGTLIYELKVGDKKLTGKLISIE